MLCTCYHSETFIGSIFHNVIRVAKIKSFTVVYEASDMLANPQRNCDRLCACCNYCHSLGACGSKMRNST